MYSLSRSYTAQQSLYLFLFLIHQTGFYPKVANKVKSNQIKSNHCTIGMRPIDVNKNNDVRIAKKYFTLAKIYKGRKTKIHLGDTVRLSRYKHQGGSVNHYMLANSVQSSLFTFNVKRAQGFRVKMNSYTATCKPYHFLRLLFDNFDFYSDIRLYELLYNFLYHWVYIVQVYRTHF